MSNRCYSYDFDRWWKIHYGHLNLDNAVKDICYTAWEYQQEQIDELTTELDNIEGY